MAWLSLSPSVCECAHDEVNVRQYCKALYKRSPLTVNWLRATLLLFEKSWEAAVETPVAVALVAHATTPPLPH